MKNDDKTTRSEWLDIVERYFDATTTIEEEKALAAFLATDESDSPEFNEIKAVMGYLSTGRSIARSKKRRTLGKATQWASIAACAAVIALIGTSINKNETQATDRDFYMACIDGKEYNDTFGLVMYNVGFFGSIISGIAALILSKVDLG